MPKRRRHSSGANTLQFTANSVDRNKRGIAGKHETVSMKEVHRMISARGGRDPRSFTNSRPAPAAIESVLREILIRKGVLTKLHVRYRRLFLTGKEASQPLLERMNEFILHRGLDEDGFFTEGRCGIGMHRLSIIDLSSGKQPIAINSQAAATFGGQFVIQVPITLATSDTSTTAVSPVQTIESITVTLTNERGTSNAITTLIP